MQENSNKFPCEVIENVRNWMFTQGYLKDDLEDLVKDNMDATRKFDESIGKFNFKRLNNKNNIMFLDQRKSDFDKCLTDLKMGGGAPDPEQDKLKEEKLRREYEESIKHTYIVPPHGILPVQKECAYPVRIGEEKDLSCTEDIEGIELSITSDVNLVVLNFSQVHFLYPETYRYSRRNSGKILRQCPEGTERGLRWAIPN